MRYVAVFLSLALTGLSQSQETDAINIQSSFPAPRLALTAKEKAAIGYDKMTGSQKEAFHNFAVRYALIAVNQQHEADMNYFKKMLSDALGEGKQ